MDCHVRSGFPGLWNLDGGETLLDHQAHPRDGKGAKLPWCKWSVGKRQKCCQERDTPGWSCHSKSTPSSPTDPGAGSYHGPLCPPSPVLYDIQTNLYCWTIFLINPAVKCVWQLPANHPVTKREIPAAVRGCPLVSRALRQLIPWTSSRSSLCEKNKTTQVSITGFSTVTGGNILKLMVGKRPLSLQ